MKFRCTNGHDRCGQMYAGPDCQYCERVRDVSAAEEPFSASRGLMDDLNAERAARQADRLIRDDLLEACRIALALTVSPSSDTYEADVEKIRAAVDKAEGRS